MALPKLNSTPTYEMTIPSSGQKVIYRPFLVKEQKNLLIAFESQNRGDLLRSVVNTINICVEDKIEGTLSTFDVDYMFTKIRSKSVGEVSTILMKCDECETDNEIKIDLDEVEVVGDMPDMNVAVTDDIVVKMKFPTYDDFLSNQELLDSNTATEALLHLVVSCMDSVLTDDERVSIKDEPQEEIINFLESMTTEQFERISQFAISIPTLSKDVEFECESCNHHNKKTLRGMDDFF